MKKLLILAACAMFAVVTNAAAVGWTCAGAAGYANYSIYVVGKNGVTGADQIKALVAAGGLSSASSYAFASGALNNGVATVPVATSPYSITYSGSGVDTYTAFVFVEDAAGTKASYSGNMSIQMDNDATSKTFLFGSQAANFTSNNFTVNTPEPTSGMLLLLGMAGLALKRKRA